MKEYITSDKIFSHLNRLCNYLDLRRVDPITVEVHPTNRCDNKCYYCIANRYRGEQTLSERELVIIIGKLAEMGVKGIIFSGGGEPFCSPHLKMAAETARIEGMDVGIITNGYGIKKKDYLWIVKECEWIRISLDTINKKIYKKIRGVDGLDRVVENIRGLVKERKESNSSCTIGTQAVVTPYNIEGLFETAKFVKDLGVDYFQIRPLEGDYTYTTEEFEKIYYYIKISKALEHENFKIIDTAYKWNEVDPLKDIKKDYKKCHILPFNGAVDACGDIYLCCHLVGYNQFCYGNLLTDSVEDIFERRDNLIENFKINPQYCPVACRGSLVNQTIEENYFKEKKHKNFL